MTCDDARNPRFPRFLRLGDMNVPPMCHRTRKWFCDSVGGVGDPLDACAFECNSWPGMEPYIREPIPLSKQLSSPAQPATGFNRAWNPACSDSADVQPAFLRLAAD